MSALSPEELPEVDLLAKKDTEPHTIVMVPYELAMILLIAFFAIDVQMHSLWDGFVIAPLYGLAIILCRRDLNGVRVFLVRFRLALTLLDAYRWGGPSASPWPLAGKRGERHDG